MLECKWEFRLLRHHYYPNVPHASYNCVSSSGNFSILLPKTYSDIHFRKTIFYFTVISIYLHEEL